MNELLIFSHIFFPIMKPSKIAVKKNTDIKMRFIIQKQWLNLVISSCIGFCFSIGKIFVLD